MTGATGTPDRLLLTLHHCTADLGEAVMQPTEFAQHCRSRPRLIARLAQRRERQRQRIISLPRTTVAAAVPAAVAFAAR